MIYTALQKILRLSVLTLEQVLKNICASI